MPMYQVPSSRKSLDKGRLVSFPPLIVQSVTDFQDPGPLEWLWHGVLARRKLTLISGQEKAGKTTFLCEAIRTLTLEYDDGVGRLGAEVEPCRILIYSEEDNWAWRREEFGLNSEDILVVDGVLDRDQDWDTWAETCDMLGRAAVDLSIDVVVIDTVANLWPVENENDAAECKRALLSLRNVARRGPAVLAMHHISKAQASAAWSGRMSGGILGRGSTAINSNADMIGDFSEPDDNSTRRLFRYKGRYGTRTQLLLDYRGPGLGYQLVESNSPSTKAEPDSLDKVLAELLPGTPGLTMDELVTVTGLNEKTVRRAVKRGQTAKKIKQTGSGKRGDPYRYKGLQSSPGLTLAPVPLAEANGAKRSGGTSRPRSAAQ